MDYELQLRSNRYPADLSDAGEHASGRLLAEDIAAQLRQQGYRLIKRVDPSEFWVIEVSVPPARFEIIVVLFEPHEIHAQALWVAALSSKRGFWARWRGKPEDPQVLALASAFEAAVRAVDGLDIVGRGGDWPCQASDRADIARPARRAMKAHAAFLR